MSDKIKVLIVDDQQLVRDGIKALLEIKDDFSIIGTAADGQQALELLQKTPADVVLMDIRMPGLGGIDATRQIRQSNKDIRIIMLTTFNNDDYIVKAIKAGANGYLLKDIPKDDLAEAIRLAYRGVSQFSSDTIGMLVERNLLRDNNGSSEPDEEIDLLNEKEYEILCMIAEGYSNREIAEELFFTEGTVKNYVSKILNTLHLRDRVQAAIYAVQHHLERKK
ncbi:MAG: response regulator transcription factor [Chloroflexi bacterium]|jgi:DNA-binding NarL/FixJ family response regulator|nr:response regulator transcription factor [Chloroflexota bacterium]